MISLATNNAEVGGGEVMLVQLADAIRAADRDVQVVAPAQSEVGARARAAGHRLVELKAPDRRAWMRELRRWDRRREGVLWCNGLVPAAATAGHPRRVVHLHRLPSGIGQQVAARLARQRVLATVVPSAFMGRTLGARVLPNWSPRVHAAPREGGRRLAVGFLGRLSPDKGIGELFAAVAHVPELALVVAGEARFAPDEDARRIEVAANATGDRVTQLGWTAPADLFARVDALAVPSTWPEPFGLVVTEAMSARVPVVVSDAGALPEVVGPDHPWVARAGDVDDLARVLREVIDATPAERAAIGDAGHARWEALYSPAAGHGRVRGLLDDLGL